MKKLRNNFLQGQENPGSKKSLKTRLRMEEYILKKEKEKRVERMDLKEKAEQTKREIADQKCRAQTCCADG